MTIQDELLVWYDSRKRDLPWRKDKDPYKIWVSEIMLQQTRVETVKPYFERWVDRFPTLASLAAASEEEVLFYWQGLGYYSRARNLHQGVREVQTQYGGSFPKEKADMLQIAGIGQYTAGAILSIAFDQQESAVDGNVLRIFSRLYCLGGHNGKVAFIRQIEQLVREVLPAARPGDFNQALMDLGATICLPQAPVCEQCPITSYCSAYRDEVQNQYPLKTRKKPPLSQEMAVAIMLDKGRYLLQQRPAKGLLAKMWQFPMVSIEPDEEVVDVLRQKVLVATGCQIEVGSAILEMSHIFSHRRWHITCYVSKLVGKIQQPEATVCWASPAEWGEISFAGPHRKLAGWLTTPRDSDN